MKGDSRRWFYGSGVFYDYNSLSSKKSLKSSNIFHHTNEGEEEKHSLHTCAMIILVGLEVLMNIRNVFGVYILLI